MENGTVPFSFWVRVESGRSQAIMGFVDRCEKLSHLGVYLASGFCGSHIQLRGRVPDRLG